MREYSEIESKNIDFLKNNYIPFAIIRMTENILKHSIFDANAEIREFLCKYKIHDFNKQQFGQEHKVFIKTHILTFVRDIITNTSLYRAGTRGDYRMWFGSSILPLTKADELYVILCLDSELFTVNITNYDIDSCCSNSINNPIKKTIQLLLSQNNI